MAVRYVEFFDLGNKSAVTYLNEFIKWHSGLEIEPIGFAYDNEGQSGILARVRGSDSSIVDLEIENELGGLSGWSL